jgi:hypothetical protein
MRYTMLICGVEDEWRAYEDAHPDAMDQIMAWFAKWEAAGKIAPGGAELDSVRTAKTIRPGPDGPVVTDGPYLELKEVVGGVVFLEADSIDEAVAIAAGWPMWGNASIEVRPVVVRA